MEQPTTDPHTRLWKNKDNTFTLRMSERPLRAVDEKGAPGPLDLTLSPSEDGRLHPRRSAARVSVASTSWAGLATIEMAPGKAVAMAPEGVSAGVPGRPGQDDQGGLVSYEHALADATVQVRPLPEGVESIYVVGSAGSGSGLVETLSLPAGYSVRQDGGGIQILDEGGKQVGAWQGGLAWDSAKPVGSTGVSLKLLEVAGGVARAQVVVDSGWLGDPKRVYPVRIDPTTTRLYISGQTGTTYGAGYVWSQDPYPDHWNTSDLQVGLDSGGGVERTFIRFPDGSVPANSRIIGATLSLFQTGAGTCSPQETDVRPLSSNSWSGSTMTWPNQPPIDGTAGYMTSASFYGGTPCGAASWFSIDASYEEQQAYTNWQRNHTAANGLAVLAQYESNHNYWKDLGGTASSNAPTLDVTYESYGSGPIALDSTGNYRDPTPSSSGFQGMTLTDQGSDAWQVSCNTSSGPPCYTVSYHLYDSVGNLVPNYTPPQTALVNTVAPGGSQTMSAAVSALPQGIYTLAWDMYEQPPGTWFSNYGTAMPSSTVWSIGPRAWARRPAAPRPRR